MARPDAGIGKVGRPSCDPVPALQCQLHAGRVLGSVHADLGHRELYRGFRRPIHRPRVRLPSRFRPSSQRRGDQACDRVDHGGTQHRSDAPDDDLSLWSRPVGHGLDHDPQHRRHHGRCAVRPDVEARCFTARHNRSSQLSSERNQTKRARVAWVEGLVDSLDVFSRANLPLPHQVFDSPHGRLDTSSHGPSIGPTPRRARPPQVPGGRPDVGPFPAVRPDRGGPRPLRPALRRLRPRAGPHRGRVLLSHRREVRGQRGRGRSGRARSRSRRSRPTWSSTTSTSCGTTTSSPSTSRPSRTSTTCSGTPPSRLSKVKASATSTTPRSCST